MLHKIFNVLIGFIFLSGSAGFVSLEMDGPEPPDREPALTRPEAETLETGIKHPAKAPLMQASAPAVDLGEPGYSLSYRKRFGISESPYLADTDHLNDPWGIFIDGSDNVYIAEGEGARLLRYEPDGDNSLAIGRVGMQYNDVDNFAWPRDSAVDGDGNIWVVDDSRAVQFDPAGTFLQEYPTDQESCFLDDEHLCAPYGIAFDSTGKMYIADTENHRVQVFSFTAGAPVYHSTIGESFNSGSDPDHFNYPVRVAVDGLDRVYVVDSENHRIQRCEYDDGLTVWECETFDGTGFEGNAIDELAYPQGIAVHGSNVFIADSDNYRVKKCDLSGSCSILISDLAWPLDVAVDSAGAVYVVENSNSYTVSKNDAAGNFIGVFAGVNRAPYLTDQTRMNSPAGVGVDRSGNIYVLEQRGHRLLKLNPNGTRLWTIGEPGISLRDNTHFGHLRGSAAFDASGRVYVSDTNRHRVQIYSAAGAYFNTIGTPNQADCDNAHFNSPNGVAISPLNGDIFVVDRENHRVQVFTSGRIYKGTLGDPNCSPGSDNSHLDWPHGVAVDQSGNIYVADRGNHRVQKFNSSLVHVKTFGQTGVFNNNYGVVAEPIGVAVDAAGRVFVLENWNRRVQVFDADGAFLTSIGQSWGGGTAQMRSPQSIALDSAGCLYVAERENHRVQKFCPGTPGWVQRSLYGFGDRTNYGVLSLGEFDGMLYAGTSNGSGTGAQLYRTADGKNWSQVFADGLGDTTNEGIDSLGVFGDHLYLGTINWNYVTDSSNGAQIWRSEDGAIWDEVTPAGIDENDAEAMVFETFGAHLYMGTWAANATEGAEIWRTADGGVGTWTKVEEAGNDNVNNGGITAFAVHNNHLYAGTYNNIDGCEVWVSEDGESWGPPVASGGFGDGYNFYIGALNSFGGRLYAGTYNYNTSDNPGGELWRCQDCTGSDWEPVVDAKGFGSTENRAIMGLITYQDLLYAVTVNSTTGAEVWRSADGLAWEKVNEGGFGSAANRLTYYNNAVATFNNFLFVGMFNSPNGAAVWMYLPFRTFLPLTRGN